MKEIELKYGCNPNQKPAKIFMKDGSDLPVEVLNGRPGYINFLDGFNSFQLVQELKEATGSPAAASFKHVSPAGAAIAKELSDTERKMYFVPESLQVSPIASAYIRARGTDRVSSYGDFIALSEPCDLATALYIKMEVSDGIIAPDYLPEALEVLKAKKKGNYVVLKMNPEYKAALYETKDVDGITFQQGHNFLKIDDSLLTNIVTENKNLTEQAKKDMLVALITLKYTQSNSVCFVKDGQAIGVGAGQQSRIHCTRLAGSKADKWMLRHNELVTSLPFIAGLKRPDKDNVIDLYLSEDSDDVLSEENWPKYFTKKPEEFTLEMRKQYIREQSGITIGSDAFFPFGDNIERARKSGADYIVEPGGSIRDDNVIETANKYHMVMVFNGVRLFHH